MFWLSGLDADVEPWQLLAESIAQGFTGALIGDLDEELISSRHLHRGPLV
jgi:hypothetical protein